MMRRQLLILTEIDQVKPAIVSHLPHQPPFPLFQPCANQTALLEKSLRLSLSLLTESVIHV